MNPPMKIWSALARLFLLAAALGGWIPRAHAAETVSLPYNEWRIYTVSSNKMSGVLERFRETVEPLRRRHSITTMGYWTAPGTTNAGSFIYWLTDVSRDALKAKEMKFGQDPGFGAGNAQSNRKHGKTVDSILSIPLRPVGDENAVLQTVLKQGAFDLRIYSIVPGKLDLFRDRWRQHAIPIYARHGLRHVGWWVAEAKDAEGHEQFVCLLTAESFDALQKGIAEFHKDPDWQRVEKETESHGKLRSGVTSFKLTPIHISTTP